MGIRIADLPDHERPRERLFRRGPTALGERELLALVLRNGRPGESAVDLAGGLLAEFGGLSGLATARPEELARRPGVGPAKAAAVVAALRIGRLVGEPMARARLSSPADIAAAAATDIGDAPAESVVVLVCDGADRLKATITVATGAADRVPVPVREVVSAVLRHDGRSFAIAHNHPSGDPTPSAADREATVRLCDAASVVGLRFLDHVVVGASGTWARATPPGRTHRSGSTP